LRELAQPSGSGADGHQDTDPWTPHISVAYSNGSGPAAPIVAKAWQGLPDLAVTIRSLSLVAQVQTGRSWQWRQVAEIEFGGN
jgi:2'-5' RNA ligase superfamily